MRDGWTETTLGDVVELGKGGAWGADEMEPNRVEAICLRGTDLADLIDKKHPEAPVRWLTPTELKKAACAPNMVLIETSGSKCGRSVVLTSEMLSGFALPVVYSNFCRTLRIDTCLLSSRYVEMWFSHMYEVGVIPSYRATSAMPNLDVKSLLRMEMIAVPPLAEQKRIVDVVASVDAYIDALQRQVDSARTARNAVLHELIVLPSKHRKKMEDFVFLKRGHDLPTQSRVDGEFPVIASNGTVGWHNEQIGPIPGVITGRSGTIGKVVFATGGYWPLNTTLYVTEFMGNDEKFAALTLETMRLEKFAGGSTVPSLDRKVLRSELVFAPPIEEQKRIVEIVSAMDDVIQSTEQAVVEAKNLRSGLLSDLLSGNHEIPASYDSLLGAA